MSRKLINQVIQEIEQIIPIIIKQLIDNMAIYTIRKIKYVSDEYIGPEIFFFHTNKDIDDYDWKSKFDDMGLHIQQYSSGNVRIRISHRNNDKSIIGLCINAYYDEYDRVSVLVNKYINYDRIYHNLQHLKNIVLKPNILSTTSKYIKDELFIDENLNYETLKHIVSCLKEDINLHFDEYQKKTKNEYIEKITVSFDILPINDKRYIIRCLLNSSDFETTFIDMFKDTKVDISKIIREYTIEHNKKFEKELKEYYININISPLIKLGRTTIEDNWNNISEEERDIYKQRMKEDKDKYSSDEE